MTGVTVQKVSAAAGEDLARRVAEQLDNPAAGVVVIAVDNDDWVAAFCHD